MLSNINIVFNYAISVYYAKTTSLSTVTKTRQHTEVRMTDNSWIIVVMQKCMIKRETKTILFIFFGK